jgi:hypothetical protein
MLHQLQNQRRSVGTIEVVPGQQHPTDKMNTKIQAKTQNQQQLPVSGLNLMSQSSG